MNKKAFRTFEEDQEWENHLILRFPPEIASRVQKMLDEELHANDRITIAFNNDLRSGKICLDKEELHFTMYDLPTITEVMKTYDKKTVYKVADISQIIVASTSPTSLAPTADGTIIGGTSAFSPGNPHNIDEPQKDGADKCYEWPHGLCPPMWNVRKRRFRKIKKKNYMDIPEVEKELKRLLRADLDAQAIRWEVCDGVKPKDVSVGESEQKISVPIQPPPSNTNKDPLVAVEPATAPTTVAPSQSSKIKEETSTRTGFLADDLSLSDSEEENENTNP